MNRSDAPERDLDSRRGRRAAISSEGYAAVPRFPRMAHAFLSLVQRLGVIAIRWDASSPTRSVDLGRGRPTVCCRRFCHRYDYVATKGSGLLATGTDRRIAGCGVLDRRTPPLQIARAGDQVSFAADGHLVFRSLEEQTNALVRIKKDGSEREQITTPPVLDKSGVSPDGEWVLIGSPGAGVDAVTATFAVPIHDGGRPKKICAPSCQAGWSSDGKFFYVSMDLSAAASSPGTPGKTLAIPVPAGTSLPDLPASGIDRTAGVVTLPGARLIESVSLSTGPDPSTYVFTKTELQRNLFRIPLH